MIHDRLASALADRYRIERELGQGGMATVYLAEDLKHDRKVALKVLKPELAAVLGAERFVIEIKTTAALQHPHILPLFDSGTADGFLYYVMPFIDGETLRSKLDRETQLGVDEAVRITRDVADALDYAHRHGVVHRDIKPENILLADGRPMVADFGIALAVSAAAGGRMTETGLSLGTPHYMSPEQATADKEITGRSDIYSLASVLFEMLAGQPPHLGGSAQQIIMKIIAEPVEMVTKFRKSVPPNVAMAVAKGLEKLPADRFDSAAKFAEALGNPAFTFRPDAYLTHALASGPIRKGPAVALAALAVVAAGVAAWAWLRPPVPEAPVRYRLALFSAGAADHPWRDVALSPDGRAIAFTQSRDGKRMVWVKVPERGDAEPLPGTEGAQAPTFSPDGEWVAFVADGRLRKVRRSGAEAPTTIADGGGDAASTAWLDDGTVLFTGSRLGLNAVRQDGGPVRVVIPRDSLPNRIFSLAAVPGSRSALYATCASNCVQAELWAVALGSGARHKLADNAIRAWHVAGGVVVYADHRTGRILASPYDEGRLSLRGPPALVFEDVQQAGGEGISFALAADGTLLYVPLAKATATQFVWVDRDGKVAPVDSAWSLSSGDRGDGAAISPDGRRLAVVIRADQVSDIWVRELKSGGSFARLTFEGDGTRPAWSADGQSVLYPTIVERPGLAELRRRRYDGADSATVILRSQRQVASVIPLRDTTKVIVRLGPPPTRDIYLALRRGAKGDTLVPLLANDGFEEVTVALSPDERWLAYASNESGRFEVYLVPYPDVRGGRWQVSLTGGRSPRWARSGRELFFRDLADGVVAVPVGAGPTPSLGERRLLFHLDGMSLVGSSGDPMQPQFEVAPDDRRFLFERRLGGPEAANTAVLVRSWRSELRERMKTAR